MPKPEVGVAVLVVAIAVAGCAPSAGAPAATPPPAATSAATVGPTHVETVRPTATATPTTLGGPIPEELVGAWYHPSGAYWWLVRAGAPTCVVVAHTALDCVAYQLAGQPAYVGAATMAGRVLHISWTRGY